MRPPGRAACGWLVCCVSEPSSPAEDVNLLDPSARGADVVHSVKGLSAEPMGPAPAPKAAEPGLGAGIVVGSPDRGKVRTGFLEDQDEIQLVDVDTGENKPTSEVKEARVSTRSSPLRLSVNSVASANGKGQRGAGIKMERGSTLRDLETLLVVNSVISSASTRAPLTDELDPMHGLRDLADTAASSRPVTAYYVIAQELGKGAFGTVVKVKKKGSGQQFAMKIIDTAQVKDQKRFETELEVSRKLQHPNIIRLFEFYRGGTAGNEYRLVMELCTGGDLHTRVQASAYNIDGVPYGGLPTSECARYAWEMLSGLAYLHHYQIAHRDVKPENYMLLDQYDGTPLKLIDFGLARQFSREDRMTSKVGTPQYAAPEITQHNEGYNEKCDVWSLGCTLYVIGCSCFPFDAREAREVFRLTYKGEYNFNKPSWSLHPHGFKDLIALMLTVEPTLRPNARRLLSDEWLLNMRKRSESCCAVS